MRLNDFAFGTRLAAGYLVWILMAAVMGGYALLQLKGTQNSVEELAADWLPSISLASRMRETVSQVRRTQADLLVRADADSVDDARRRTAELSSKFTGMLRSYEPLIANADERAIYDGLGAAWQALAAASERLQTLAAATGQDRERRLGQQFAQDLQTAYGDVATRLDKLIEVNELGASRSYDNARTAYSHSKLWLVLLFALAFPIAVLQAVWATHMVTRPLSVAIRTANAIAQGDLTHTLHSEGKDEAARLLSALSAMQDRLREVVASVRRNADSVATASAEIAQGNADLSQRTEQQANALQRTASAMEELAVTVRDNASSAEDASQLAGGADEVAARGGQAVREVVQTIRGIDESTARMGEIISVIDGIAFQTNILALNAAVEAARAGDHGRGFAVVASEVRGLAQRSAQAAREVKTLIDASSAKVSEGVRLADAAGDTMGGVVGDVQRVKALMTDISQASARQSASVADVAQAVTSMDAMTQQNAALVEQSAAAADSMSQQARQLVQTVGFFRITPGG
ncbi:MAG TPA: methyl-accepting chemotaxis protein [Burkholderiaceae bacterium]|nr:methyl-accepting chemotaxis protein [Burkholderiaceae bacterium]